LGFSDKQISIYSGTTEYIVRALREEFYIRPFIKKIDTIFDGWSAKSDYLYLSYNSNDDDIQRSTLRWPDPSNFPREKYF
jgi:carbamoyl-phosphate synthase large subunit